MSHRSPSPSARFYAHSNSPNMPQMLRQQLHPTDETGAIRARHIEPFTQFQGFSAPSTRQELEQPRFGVYSYDVPEDGISPRMVVLNTASWETPRSRVQSFAEDAVEDHPQPRIYQSCCDVVIQNNVEADTQQWLPSHNLGIDIRPTPPYVCVKSTEPLPHVQECYHADPLPPPVSSGSSRHANTFRVPSDSEPGHISGRLDSLPMDALSDELAVEKQAVSLPSSTMGEGVSTIYPEDSVSATCRAGAAPNAVPLRSLVDYVVEIHDICLAATQRHLESLRVNWDLRHGRAAGELNEDLLGARSPRDLDRGRGDRWAPYTEAGSRRRARSETHLGYMAMGKSGEHHHDGRHRHRPTFNRENPIPMFTNSLLHNIRLVCDLIWRRAQRDREDVLGAEAKGCREMSFLHDCGETIVLYNIMDAERDPQACWHRLVTAGVGLCRVLGDSEGMRLMGVEAIGTGWASHEWMR